MHDAKTIETPTYQDLLDCKIYIDPENYSLKPDISIWLFILKGAFQAVYEMKEEKGVSYRQAALMITLKRIIL